MHLSKLMHSLTRPTSCVNFLLLQDVQDTSVAPSVTGDSQGSPISRSIIARINTVLSSNKQPGSTEFEDVRSSVSKSVKGECETTCCWAEHARRTAAVQWQYRQSYSSGTAAVQAAVQQRYISSTSSGAAGQRMYSSWAVSLAHWQGWVCPIWGGEVFRCLTVGLLATAYHLHVQNPRHTGRA